MDDVKADANGGFRRVEVLTGPARRRRWSDAEKARIVAETLAPDASVSDVARRWQVCSQQVFTWRREARAGHLVLPLEAAAPAAKPGFVPIVAESQPEAIAPATESPSTSIRLFRPTVTALAWGRSLAPPHPGQGCWAKKRR